VSVGETSNVTFSLEETSKPGTWNREGSRHWRNAFAFVAPRKYDSAMVSTSCSGVIPGLLHIEIGFDVSKSADSADIVLYSEFESLAALDGYQNHPGHLAMVPMVREVRVERRVGDYEV
jgi:stress responsive alpha/beta barrel protein